MMKLNFHVFTEPNGRHIADWSARLRLGDVSRGDRGNRSLTGFVRMISREALRFYDQAGLYHGVLSLGALELWIVTGKRES